MKLSSLVIIALALGAFAAGCASGTDPGDDFDAGRLVGVDTGPGGPRVDAAGPPRDAGIDARFDAGQDAGVCVPTCTSDFDCQNSCPANPLGVNCVRKLPGYGRVIWGSRTLSTQADPEWRYVPVRRTAIFIEQSIYNGIQWAVFEPNDFPLWGALRSNIGAFMNGLFRAGAFQGGTAKDAYFVRCGLGDTMTQADIDRGQVIVIVGFAPLKPAEFVIVRIQQKVDQQ